MNSADQASKFVTYYLKSQYTGMRAYEKDGVYYIVTPYYRTDGNRIAIEVQVIGVTQFPGDESVRFTYWGDTLSDARKQWLTPGHPALEAIDRIAGRFHAKLSVNDCTLSCNGTGGSSQLQDLILAIVAVSGFIEPQRDPAQTTINQFSNAGSSILKMVEKLHEAYPDADKNDHAPPDFAKNRKHYVYGFPKEDEQ